MKMGFVKTLQTFYCNNALIVDHLLNNLSLKRLNSEQIDELMAS